MNNKTVLITGGANGIGKSLVSLFSSKGYKVVFVDVDETSSNLLIKNNNNIIFFPCDISNKNQVVLFQNFLKENNLKIDILINNAAIQKIEPFMNSNFTKVIEVNLLGTMLFTQACCPFMAKDSTILNVNSVHATKPRLNHISYDVSKSGLLMFTKELALELAPLKITVNSISIGATYTNMNCTFEKDEKTLKEALQKIPMNYIATPEEIAKHIYNIIDSFSSHTTGSDFVIDGGRSLI